MVRPSTRSLLAALMLVLLAGGARAQSSPGLYTGFTPTATQWNSYFAAKADYNAAATSISIAVNTAPTAAMAGASYYATGSLTFTLPNSLFMAPGARPFSVNAALGAVTVNIASTDRMNGGSPGVGLTLTPGQWALFYSDGAGNWRADVATATGGSGSLPVTEKITGVVTTHTLTAGTANVVWDSSATAGKTENVPACAAGNIGETHTVTDEAGTAGTYPITLTPPAGTDVGGATTYALDKNFSGVQIVCDGAGNWAPNAGIHQIRTDAANTWSAPQTFTNTDTYSGTDTFAGQITASGTVGGTLAPHVASTAVLAAAHTSKYPQGVTRDHFAAGGFAIPLFFQPQTGTCAANGYADDGGQCVDVANVLTGATLTAGGLGSAAGYHAGDVLTLVGGTYVFSAPAQVTVDTVDGGGGILTWHVSYGGLYSVEPASFTVTGGAGAGAVFGSPTWTNSDGNSWLNPARVLDAEEFGVAAANADNLAYLNAAITATMKHGLTLSYFPVGVVNISTRMLFNCSTMGVTAPFSLVGPGRYLTTITASPTFSHVGQFVEFDHCAAGFSFSGLGFDDGQTVTGGTDQGLVVYESSHVYGSDFLIKNFGNVGLLDFDDANGRLSAHNTDNIFHDFTINGVPGVSNNGAEMASLYYSKMYDYVVTDVTTSAPGICVQLKDEATYSEIGAGIVKNCYNGIGLGVDNSAAAVQSSSIHDVVVAKPPANGECINLGWASLNNFKNIDCDQGASSSPAIDVVTNNAYNTFGGISVTGGAVGSSLLHVQASSLNNTFNFGSVSLRAGGASANTFVFDATSDQNVVTVPRTGYFAGSVLLSQYVTNNGGAGNGVTLVGQLPAALTSTVASGSAVPIALPGPTTVNVTSVAPGAGVWDVSGEVCFAATATGVTAIGAGIGLNSAALPTPSPTLSIGGGGSLTIPAIDGAGISPGTSCLPLASTRLTATGSTTVYLIGEETATGGTASAYGYIRAIPVAQ